MTAGFNYDDSRSTFQGYRRQKRVRQMIEEISIGDARASLDRGEHSVRALVQACLDRIASMDRQGPALHAVIEVNPEALAIADELDRELRDGRSRGLLHGIPVLLKDSIATTDGMQNTAGSLALEGALPLREAFITSRLREAGAVILGKANMSEWANIRSSHSSSGWSGRGGQTRNPYQLDRTPLGSSSGSAVAVAASYVPAAIGTETNGSICSPAGSCGIVGIKPTVGLVSRSGVIPISSLQDTTGPMTRTVADAAMMLNAMAADDPDDPAQRADGNPLFPQRPDRSPVDYTAVLDPDGLRGARIGVWRAPLAKSDATQAVFGQALETIREAGAELVDPVEFTTLEEMSHGTNVIDLLLWRLGPDIAAYLREYTNSAFPIRNLGDVVAYNREHKEREMPWFGQDILEAGLEAERLDEAVYEALATKMLRLAREDGIDAVLKEHALDAIIAPANSPATRIDLINGDHHIGGSSTPSAVAGYPIVTVPAGMYAGLPVGVNFLGGAFSEATLIRLAYAYEQASQARRPPTYAPAGVLPPEMTV